MNKLLQFYVPKVLLEVSKFFGVAVALSLVIKILPIGNDGKSIFINMIMYLILPFLVYFTRLLYLPASMEWILLTPIKKTHVIFVHGLINIFKLVLVFALISLFFLVTEKYFLFSEIWEVLAKSGYDRFTYDRVLGLIGFFGLCCIFTFGILPNYVQSMQDKQNYQVKRTKKELFKRYALAGLGGMIFLGLEEGTVDHIIPDFLKFGAAYVGLFFLAVISTLTSLRFYFSKKKMLSIASTSFVIFSCYLYIHSVHDFKSNNVTFREKLEAFDYLGSFIGDLDQEIEKELFDAGPDVATLNQRDVNGLRKDLVGLQTYFAVVDQWTKLCSERMDYTCRLAYYGQVPDAKIALLPNVIQACHNDLGSCLVIYDNKDVPAVDQKMALGILTKKCPTLADDPDHSVCNAFKYGKGKKPVKIKR